MNANLPSEAQVLPWHKSTYSGQTENGAGCVEHGGFADGTQIMRDSKDPERKVAISFTSGAWQSFVDMAKASPQV